MRFFSFIFILTLSMASSGLATDYKVTTKVIAATLHGEGAVVTRSANINVPAGVHRIEITNMPLMDEILNLQIAFGDTEVKTRSLSFSGDDLPLPLEESVAAVQVKASLRAAESNLRDLTFRDKALRAEITAAKAQIAYLESLSKLAGKPEDTGLITGETISGASGAIGAEYLAAMQAVLAAERSLEVLADEFASNERAVEIAKAQYKAVEPMARSVNTLAVLADFPKPYSGTIEITHFMWSIWRPVFELHLAQNGASGKVRIDRHAILESGNGPAWKEVAVTLSSAQLDRSISIWDPNYRAGRLFDKVRPKSLSRSDAEGASSEPMMEPVAMEEHSGGTIAQTKGQVVLFKLPGLMDLSESAEMLVSLDSLEFDIDLTAKIVPSIDSQTAYLTGDVINSSGGTILPGNMWVYRDGVFIGVDNMPEIGAGEEVEFSFGEYDGIEVQRELAERLDGDVGIISSSNTRVIRHLTKITSHLDFKLPFRVLDVIPNSEDEDLTIDMQARPTPDEMNVDDKRGVVAWNFELSPGEMKTIEFGYQAQWPPDRNFEIR